MASRVAVLFSGGLDSAILYGGWRKEGQNPVPLYVRTGAIWEHAELAMARRFLHHLGDAADCLVTLDLPVGDIYGDHWSLTGENVPGLHSPDPAVCLPGRNLLLLSKAVVWCQLQGIEQLAVASLGTSPFADARPDFFADYARAARCAGPLTIMAPFADWSKRRVMQWGRTLPLAQTFSCLLPRHGLHCGNCNKCGERRAAFELAELADPTPYAQQPVQV